MDSTRVNQTTLSLAQLSPTCFNFISQQRKLKIHGDHIKNQQVNENYLVDFKTRTVIPNMIVKNILLNPGLCEGNARSTWWGSWGWCRTRWSGYWPGWAGAQKHWSSLISRTFDHLSLEKEGSKTNIEVDIACIPNVVFFSKQEMELLIQHISM